MCLAAGEGERHPVRQPASLSTKQPKREVKISPAELNALINEIESIALIQSESLGLKGNTSSDPYWPLTSRTRGFIDSI